MWNGRGATLLAYGLCVAVLLGAATGMRAMVSAYELHLKKLPIDPPGGRVVSSIPRETESWVQVGSDSVMPKDVVQTLGTDNYVSRQYRLKDDDADEGEIPVVLDFHAAYYTGGIDTVPHVPERCFVGGGLRPSKGAVVLPLEVETDGWSPDRSVASESPDVVGEQGVIYRARTSNVYSDAPGIRVRMPRDVGPGAPLRMRVSEFSSDADGRKLFAGYFFIANGGTVANATGVRELAFSLTSDYAYYMKVQITSPRVSSSEEMAELSASLVGELLPDLMRCVPDWVEVMEGRYPESAAEAG